MEIVDTSVGNLPKLLGSLCVRKENTSYVHDDAVQQWVLREESCEDAVHCRIALRLANAGNRRTRKVRGSTTSRSHRLPHVMWLRIGLPFAIRSKLPRVLLAQRVALDIHPGMAITHNLLDLPLVCGGNTWLCTLRSNASLD